MGCKLNFGLDEYMADGAVDIPNENDTTVGDGTDVSKEVGPDGEPLPDTKQDETRLDPYDLSMQSKLASSVNIPARAGVDEYSEKWKDSSGDQPYCPVYVSNMEGGGRKFEAYLTGPVNDVDDYIDLIDTLLTASEKDRYVIYIDSPGGLIAAGGLISSAIHHSKATVITEARGICASAAALIHSSAKKGNAIASPFAVMMYHMSSHADMGYSTKIEERAHNQVRYVNECLINKALDDGHITQEEFDNIQNGIDVYIPASKFTRRVLGDDDSIAASEDFSFSGMDLVGLHMRKQMQLPMWLEEKSPEEMAAVMSGNGPKGKESALLIRTCDKKNYRVYMKADWWFTQKYINGLCRFLDTRSEGETVTFILGTRMSDWQAHIIGAVISAMQRCKATVNTVAAGYCSITETLIWCFGKNRDVYRYGALSFGTTEFLKYCKEYRAYFEYVFQIATSIGIITEDDVQHIWDTGSEKQILYKEYKELFPD